LRREAEQGLKHPKRASAAGNKKEQEKQCVLGTGLFKEMQNKYE